MSTITLEQIAGAKAMLEVLDRELSRPSTNTTTKPISEYVKQSDQIKQDRFQAENILRAAMRGDE